MKIVKLNRRYKAYKDGFTHALRFNSWNSKASEIEKLLSNRYYSQYAFHKGGGVWSSGYGTPPRGSSTRPFWINLKNEADITMILLSGDYRIRS